MTAKKVEEPSKEPTTKKKKLTTTELRYLKQSLIQAAGRGNEKEVARYKAELIENGWQPSWEDGLIRFKPVGIVVKKDDPKHRHHILRQDCLFAPANHPFCAFDEPDLYYLEQAPSEERGWDKWAIPLCEWHLKELARAKDQGTNEKAFFDMRSVDVMAAAQELWLETEEFRAGQRTPRKQLDDDEPDYSEGARVRRMRTRFVG